MKKIIFVVLFVAFAAFAAAAVNTEYYGKSPRIDVSLANYDPDPVEPGRIVEASFKLDNKGTAAEDVMFEILPEYPFSLLPGEATLKYVGSLGVSQNSDRSVFVKYKLKIDQNAVDGNYEIKAKYKTENFDWTTVEELKVKVQSHDAIIGVDKYVTMPEAIAPGERAMLLITIKNYATSLLKDVKVVVELGKSGDVETPFSPVGSTNEKVISSIDPQSSESIEFDLIADPDAKSDTYKIPLRIQYSDVLNKNYSKTNTLSLVVGTEPDISVYIESTTIYTPDNTGEATIKIVNKGLTDIKFLSIKLSNGAGYKILSPYEVYIGNIDSDDYETVDYKLSVEKTTEKKLVLPLTIEYKDANNQNYKKNVNVELPLYTRSEAKKFGLVKGNGKVYYYLAIIAIVLAFFGYRRWKKRRK